MIIEKSELKSTITTTIVCLVALTFITFGFNLYHNSKYVKGEYDRVCPQNYGDPISLDRCYWSYRFEGVTLQNAIKAEVAAIFIVPILIFVTSVI